MQVYNGHPIVPPGLNGGIQTGNFSDASIKENARLLLLTSYSSSTQRSFIHRAQLQSLYLLSHLPYQPHHPNPSHRTTQNEASR